MQDYYDTAYFWKDVRYVMDLTIAKMYAHRFEMVRLLKEYG